MAWKYVMFRVTIGETSWKLPVIFPDKLVHADVAAHLEVCVADTFKLAKIETVSAGAIESVLVSGIGGRSETLGISSKPREDSDTICGYSYFHGVE